MQLKLVILVVLAVLIGGFAWVKMSEEKKVARKSDYFKDNASHLKTDDGKKY